MKVARVPDHLVAGEGDKTVFLLHGGYGSKDYWGPQILRVAEQGYRVVAWDAPGYGISPIPDCPYTIEMLAEACRLLIEQTGTEINYILGHSMGGLIAPKVYSLCPERISGLVLSATVQSLGHMDKQFQEEFIAERLAPMDAGHTLRDAAPALIKTMMGPSSAGAHVDLVREGTANTPDNTFRMAIRAIVEYVGEDALASIDVPTLCIAGVCDPVGRPEFMQDLANSIKDAEFVTIPDVGHYGWAEDPEAYNGHVFPFLASIAGNA